MKEFLALDLFSGCGGLTQGLKDAGFRVVGAIDNHELSVKTYRLNHPEVHVWPEKIQDVSARKVAAKLRLQGGRLDLLAGCPPCQAFSTLPTRNGSKRVRDKETKDLVLQFVRFVRRLRPKVVMLENVPRLANDRRMRVLKRKLKRLGYQVDCQVLNAAKYAVPQRRRRVLFLASRIGPVSFAKEARCSRTVRQAIGKLPHPLKSHDPLHKFTNRRTERIKERIKLIPKDGGSRFALGKLAQLGCHKRCDGFKDIYGRMAWKKQSPTITSGCLNPSKGRFLHPRQNRAITLREASLLQTFPRGYRFSLEKGTYAVAAMIGNALPPEFVRRQTIHLRHLLEKESGN